MESVEDLFNIKSLSKHELIESDYCTEILEKLDDAYNEALKTLYEQTGKKDLQLVYTPIHGSALNRTIRVLGAAGFINVHIVQEQAKQDGEFPTVSYPNPEEVEAFELAIELGQKVGAELLLETDPDGDRLGVAVLDGDSYKLLTANQLGALLLNYILLSQ